MRLSHFLSVRYFSKQFTRIYASCQVSPSTEISELPWFVEMSYIPFQWYTCLRLHKMIETSKMCNIYHRYISKVNQIYNLILWWKLDCYQCIFTHILGSPIRVLYLNRYSFCYLSLPVTVLLSYRLFVFFWY